MHEDHADGGEGLAPDSMGRRSETKFTTAVIAACKVGTLEQLMCHLAQHPELLNASDSEGVHTVPSAFLFYHNGSQGGFKHASYFLGTASGRSTSWQ
jgi:hypothetical protein